MSAGAEHDVACEAPPSTESSRALSVLVVDDDAPFAEMLVRLLSSEGHRAERADSAAAALAAVGRGRWDVVLTDVKMPGESGIDLLRELRRRAPETDVIVMTGYGTIELTVEAMRLGAADFLPKPFDNQELLLRLGRLERVRRLQNELESLRSELEGRFGFEAIVAESEGMRLALRRAAAAARTRSNVLLVGETGTGKEVVARAIHHAGPRARAPFVAINCAALPREIMESELFGHARGAFTGALTDKRGLFRAAHGGTLLLDEITEMPVETQAKLLRALETGCVRPIGTEREQPVDVRVIAATNRDPQQAVEQGRLRADLYYRLGVIVIELPPLRERPEDIEPLALRAIAELGARLERRVRGIRPEALEALRRHRWPGNVRELRNVIESALVLAPGPWIELADLPPSVAVAAGTAASDGAAQALETNEIAPLDATLKAVERRMILRALACAGGNKSRAAEMLGISRKRIYRKLEEYGMAPGDA
ncbi:MAG: sigma-54-dependent Fis family transcriptional regulator [Planctomycetota bacterium]|nr:MAG: sigma-54-dependent Fis family transcriptional regulator [Planctomycetota bacterium]